MGDYDKHDSVSNQRQSSYGMISVDEEDNTNSQYGASSLNISGSQLNSKFPIVLGGFSNGVNVSGDENVVSNNNFTTSELLSMKHALAVRNNNGNSNLQNSGRRSRSSSFYTTHTATSNTHLNSFHNNNEGSHHEIYMAAKQSQVSNEHVPSIEGSVLGGNNGGTNPLYGVISSPNSTKSITAASQLINDLLNSNEGTNILQAQQRPNINQILNSSGNIPLVSMSHSNSRNSNSINETNSCKPQLQNIITSESGLQAISESNSKLGGANTYNTVPRQSSEYSLSTRNSDALHVSSLDHGSFKNAENNKQLSSPHRDALEALTLESPVTPKFETKLPFNSLEASGNATYSSGSGFAVSRKSSIGGHSFPNMQQMSNVSLQPKILSTPSSRYANQSHQTYNSQPNLHHASSSNSLKTAVFQNQQYSINEKQYLKKIKQSQQNDYYDKSVFDSTSGSVDDLDSYSNTSQNLDGFSDVQTPVLHKKGSFKDSYFIKQPSKKLDRQPQQTQQIQDTPIILDEKIKKTQLQQQIQMPSVSLSKNRILKDKLEQSSDLKYIDKNYVKELNKITKLSKTPNLPKIAYPYEDDAYEELSVEQSRKENSAGSSERLAWQLILTRVLTGDIVTGEKSKLQDLKENSNEGEKNNFNNELWLELKAWMNGQTPTDHEKTLNLLRNSVADEIFENIANFKTANNMDVHTFKQYIRSLVDDYEKVTSYWSNLNEMYKEKPITNTVEFRTNVNMLHSWLNLIEMVDALIGKISANVVFNKEGDDYEIKSSYIEKIVKEENVQELFQEFYNYFAQTIVKINFCLHLYSDFIKENEIPVAFEKLKTISSYCPKLIQKVILYRIQVANNLTNPTMMMLDQIIDDLVHYIKLATEIKTTVNNMPTISFSDICEGIDDSIKLALNHVYEIIVLKLETKGVGLFSSTKDTDELLEHWEVFRNLGCFLGEEYGFIIAIMFLKLFLQLMMKLHVFTYQKFNTLPNFKKESEATEWILNSLETFGSFDRRFSRFFATLSTSLRNQINFKTKDQSKVIETMIDNGYTLVYTGGDLEDKGFYCFISEELILKNDGKIKKETILNSLNHSSICSDLVPSIDINKTLALTTLLYELKKESDLTNEDYYEPQNRVYWEKLNKNGIQCQDLKYDESVGQISIVFDGVKIPTFLYEKNGGNDIKITTRRSIDFLTKNTNVLEQLKNLKNNPNLFLSASTKQNVDTIGLNSETDISLMVSEVTLRKTGHVVLFKPTSPLLWEGNALYLEDAITLDELYLFQKTMKEKQKEKSNFENEEGIDDIFIPSFLKECDFIVFTEASSVSSDYLLDKVVVQFGNENMEFVNKSSSLNIVEKLLQKTSKIAFNFTDTIVTFYPIITKKINNKFRGLQTINNGFLFCRDLVRDFVAGKENCIENKYKEKILIKMLDTALHWVSFICHECTPTDLETFRWCVPAMECAMNLTSDQYILSLSEENYQHLKTSVSGCIALLISHFDVMGGRARALEENKFLLTAQQKMLGKEISLDDYEDDTLLEVNSQVRMESIKILEKQLRKMDKHKRKVGKVLNDSYREDKYIAKLASSLSNVTIKWRKKDFVGGGSFGDVFSAINLDTGGILAVKQIRIQRSKNMERIFPRIKDEMTVLEVLNHPNVVQYYGVEVHRDKVNIFMEYCDGGSLASLLEHGRFEDEVIIQVYSLELLEGLAYLHQSGVVHRDIKPENILLDHNGVVKYVDFGAAELVTKQGTKKIGTRSMMQSSKSFVSGLGSSNKNNNDMMGTPMYMAPENITGTKKGFRLGSDDIWSLGCVILEMATGKRPWANLDNEWAVMYHVAAGHIPQFPSNDEMSVAGMHFLSRMLKHNPDQRSSAVELLLDPWIADIRKLAFTSSTSSSSTSDLESLSTPTTITSR